ncbi:11110_t:CDS:2 [Funneliformis geosporum]|uniref:11110_t:CDS:1 n=1 Tax=Funneliformis geosporum TaxID=1117311 RepID=A0A9W4SHW8_9GLOM|nr:11110_t:CDS:2 [Funneliformis geosporum]
MVSLKLISLIALVTFLVTLIESAPAKTCPFAIKYINEPLNTYIVTLKTPSNHYEAVNAEIKHFNLLKECADKKISNILNLSNLVNKVLDSIRKDPKNILNFSVKGLSFCRETSIQATRKILNDDKFSRNEKVFKSQDDDKTSLKNLDRVDERKFTLDGKYKSPIESAKERMFIFLIRINTGHLDFEGRAEFAAAVCTVCENHGTMVAEIVGGSNFGIAKLVKLITIKVLNAQEHEKSQNKKTIINMSLGFGQRVEEVDRAVKNAHYRALLILPVGLQTASGISFSSPHVAGAFACIIANKNLTPDQA